MEFDKTRWSCQTISDQNNTKLLSEGGGGKGGWGEASGGGMGKGGAGLVGSGGVGGLGYKVMQGLTFPCS